MIKLTVLLLYQVVTYKATPVTDSLVFQLEDPVSHNSPVKRSQDESESGTKPAFLGLHVGASNIKEAGSRSRVYRSPETSSYISSDYERLKSLMFYSPTASDETNYGYRTLLSYDNDNEDIRSASGNTYEAWPYFHQNPFDFTQSSVEYEMAKAKDKRYANEGSFTPIRDVIPVHETIEEDISTPYRYSTPSSYVNYGEQPFFSYVIQDYSKTKSPEEDSFSFNAFDLPDDYEDKHYHDDDSAFYPPRHQYHSKEHKHHIGATTNNELTDKGYNKKDEFDKHEKGSNENFNEKAAYEQAEKNYNGFKKFSENFANRFGSENNNKDSKYITKNLQDKAEKKKGFHRVYHKDEYQMDKEFYDNTANLAQVEEKGDSKLNNGGNVGSLQSNAVASVSDRADASHKAGSLGRKHFANSHSGFDGSNGQDKQYNRYNNINTHEELGNSRHYARK